MKAKLILILMSLNLFAWNTEFTCYQQHIVNIVKRI